MEPDSFRAWVERAAPGDDVVYCVGARPSEAIGAAVRAMSVKGLVLTTSRRKDGQLRHIAVRLADRPAPVRARPSAHRGRFVPREDAGRRAVERAIMRLLTDAARRGAPCPTNKEIAQHAGLSGAVAASYRVRRLVQAGKIIVEEPSPIERRVVTILATGKSTRRAKL